MCLAGKRQTVLFSATQTRNVEDLARVSLKKAPLYVGVDDHKDTSTVDGLEQVHVPVCMCIRIHVHYIYVYMCVYMIVHYCLIGWYGVVTPICFNRSYTVVV